MNLRNMERSRLFRFTGLQRSAMVLFFSASKRTKRKRLEHQRGSFFLACKLMSQLGMALVRFDRQHCCSKNVTICRTTGVKIRSYIPETESENEFRPLDERIDEFHPKATRTLFIGNLEKTTTYHDLLNIFQRFGEIVVG